MCPACSNGPTAKENCMCYINGCPSGPMQHGGAERRDRGLVVSTKTGKGLTYEKDEDKLQCKICLEYICAKVHDHGPGKLRGCMYFHLTRTLGPQNGGRTRCEQEVVKKEGAAGLAVVSEEAANARQYVISEWQQYQLWVQQQQQQYQLWVQQQQQYQLWVLQQQQLWQVQQQQPADRQHDMYLPAEPQPHAAPKDDYQPQPLPQPAGVQHAEPQLAAHEADYQPQTLPQPAGAAEPQLAAPEDDYQPQPLPQPAGAQFAEAVEAEEGGPQPMEAEAEPAYGGRG